MVRHIKNGDRNLQRLVATLLILAQINFVAIFANSNRLQEGNAFNPIIHYNGAPLTSGMELPIDAVLTAYYEFTAEQNDLCGSTLNLTLPEPLLANDGSIIEVTAKDAAHNIITVGELSVGSSGNDLIISFNAEPAADETEPPAEPPDEEEIQNPPLDENEEQLPPEEEEEEEGEEENLPKDDLSDPQDDGNGDGTPTDNGKQQPDILTVSFAVPCSIDRSKLTDYVNSLYHINIISGMNTIGVQVRGANLVAPRMLGVGLFNGGEPQKFEEAVDITAGGLYRYTGDEDDSPGDPIPKGYVLLKDGGKISVDSDLLLYYEFTLDEQIAVISNKIKNNSSSSYVLPITVPEGIVWNQQSDQVIYAQGVGENEKFEFATIYVNNNGVAYIRFEGSFWDETDIESVSSAITLLCGIDTSKISNNDEVIVRIGVDGVIISIEPAPKEEVTHNLVKSGSNYDPATNCFKWTITYTPPSDLDDITEPLTFKDVFSSNQIMVDNSLKIGAASASVFFEVYENTPTIGETTLEFGITGEQLRANIDSSGYLTVSYETYLTQEAFQAANDTTVYDCVYLVDGDEILASSPKIESIAYGKQKQWVTKDAEVVNLEEGTISWVVYIDVPSPNCIENLVLFDEIPAGLTLIVDSIEVRKPDSIQNDDFSFLEYPETAAGSTSVVYYAYVSTVSESSSYATEYTVTYKTYIDELFTDSVNTGSAHNYENKVWLEFDWKNGIGEGWRTPPSAGKGTFSHYVINKSVASFKRYTNQIEWTINVNPNNVNIVSGVVYDKIPAGLKFVPYENDVYCKLTPITATVITYSSYDPLNNELKFEVDNIGTTTVLVSFLTEIVTDGNNNAWSYTNSSSDTRFTNNVTFEGEVRKGDNTFSVKDTASATAKYGTDILKKDVVSYTYGNGNVITWMITVNKDGISMPNAVLRDEIAPPLQFVTDSVYYIETTNVSKAILDGLYSSSNTSFKHIPEYSSGAVTQGVYVDWLPDVSSDGSGTLNINLGSLADNNASQNQSLSSSNKKQLIVLFQTTVDVDKDNLFASATSVSATNTVYLEREGTSDEKVNHTVTIPNKVLSKNGAYNASEGTVNYIVYINPNGITLAAAKVTDTLPPGLVPDFDTIKLYYADIDKNGNLSYKADAGEHIPAEISSLEYDVAENSFTLGLPLDSSDSYILEYSCLPDPVMAAGNLKNSIEITDTNITSGSGFGSEKRINFTGSGHATFIRARKATLNIVKRDPLRPEKKLPNVGFELWTKIGEYTLCIQSKETDSDGKITFEYLTPGKKYWLKEVANEAIVGYIRAELSVSVAEQVYLEVDADESLWKMTEEKNYLNVIEFILGENAKNETITFTTDNIPKTANISFTKMDNLCKYLTGVEFTITEDILGGYTATSVSYSGIVEFINVPFGNYTLSETVPAGYEDQTDYSLIISPDGSWIIADLDEEEVRNSKEGTDNPIINIIDEEQTDKFGSIIITKRDSLRSGILLPGVTFAVYVQYGEYDAEREYDETVLLDDANGVFYRVYSDTTDEQGKLTFANLPINNTYRLVEVENAAGYSNPIVLDDDNNPTPLHDYTIDITDDEKQVNLAITNDPIRTDVSFRKENQYGHKLSGAEFKISGDAPNTYEATATAENGVVTFKDVPFGIYELVETKPAKDHSLNSTKYKLDIRSDGSYTIADSSGKMIASKDTGAVRPVYHTPVVNNSTEQYRAGSLTIIKHQTGNKNRTLAGAVFDLYAKPINSTDAAEEQIRRGETGTDGKVVFGSLAIGYIYRLEEVQAPSGHNRSTARIVNDDGSTMPLGEYSFTLDTEEASVVINTIISVSNNLNPTNPGGGGGGGTGGGGGGGGNIGDGDKNGGDDGKKDEENKTDTTYPPTETTTPPVDSGSTTNPPTNPGGGSGTTTPTTTPSGGGGTANPPTDPPTTTEPPPVVLDETGVPMGIMLHSPDGTVVEQEDGSWIEFDGEGIPLGRWTQDDEGVWIFDEYPPLATFDPLPNTGGLPLFAIVPGFGMALLAAGVYLNRRESKHQSNKSENESI